MKNKLLSKLLRAVNIILIFFLLFNLSSCGLFRQSIKNKLDQLNKYPGVNAKNNKIASEPPIVLLNTDISLLLVYCFFYSHYILSLKLH